MTIDGRRGHRNLSLYPETDPKNKGIWEGNQDKVKVELKE